jgi:hypothetical protein
MVSSIWKLSILAFVVVIAVGAKLSVPAVAQNEPSNTPEKAITLYTGARLNEADAFALVERARQKGEIRVIIGLEFAVQDEDTLSAAQEASQISRLRSVQAQVQQRSLGGGAADRVHLFETIPFMSAWAQGCSTLFT